MSSESSSNRSATAGGGRKFSGGTLTNLLKIKDATLLLMEYNDAQTIRLLRRGGFVIRIIMQAISPILITACMVGELQWPITKDSPIIRIGERIFAFAIPGLLYGLRFQSCTDEEMASLARVFRRFAHYEDHRERVTGIPFPEPENELYFWLNSRSRIEQITHSKLVQFGHFPGKSPSAIGNQASGLLKVVRMSATTQLVSKAILAGVLKPIHTDIHDMMSQQELDNGEVNSQQVFPSISVFTNVVEAVEMIWVIASGNAGLLKERGLILITETLSFKIWTLNRQGLVSLMHILSLAGKNPNNNKNEKQELAEVNSRMELNVDRGVAPIEEDTVKAKERPALQIREIRFPILLNNDG